MLNNRFAKIEKVQLKKGPIKGPKNYFKEE